ncbi:hypothetical protein FHG87_020733 [Trinorchestia longiramus]|nr:hypothetical protein FHG87_020733 [Trinorchestia longiramus]
MHRIQHVAYAHHHHHQHQHHQHQHHQHQHHQHQHHQYQHHYHHHQHQHHQHHQHQHQQHQKLLPRMLLSSELTVWKCRCPRRLPSHYSTNVSRNCWTSLRCPSFQSSLLLVLSHPSSPPSSFQSSLFPPVLPHPSSPPSSLELGKVVFQNWVK